MDNKNKDLKSDEVTTQHANKDSQTNRERSLEEELGTGTNTKDESNIGDDVTLGEQEVIDGEQEIIIGEEEINDEDDLFENEDDDLDVGPIYY